MTCTAAAFGAQGLILPERRAVGVTPAAWKASAGTLARLPVARRLTGMARRLRVAGTARRRPVGGTARGTARRGI